MAGAKYILLVCLVALVLLPSPSAAFGAGNIASISKIEGRNWRHGDIEDMLKTVACLKHHKWTSMMIKRVYFGNWLRDYSQAVDVGTLKGVQAGTIRILVWVLAFMSFGYATGEFEVTDERLGVYRPEEHIDNPKDYADNVDARQYDPRLRPPVQREELAIDPDTGMKNYIANERGGWATSAGYVKYSFARSIHFGRMYTHGANKGREEDLCEALRCLGQGLHCLEDFGAHTNYTELALRELGLTNVFPHVGTATMINLHGKQVYPLVTGTFGGVDFMHSVLGEATDHVTSSEVDEMNNALGNASAGKRGGDPTSEVSDLTSLLSKIPGTSSLCQEAISLQAASDQQAASNTETRGLEDDYSASRAWNPANTSTTTFAGPPGTTTGPPGPGIPGITTTDPAAIIAKIYPILQFRDKVVRAINTIISKIPGLEDLIDKITEKVTLFVMRLLAPYIMPLIAAASASLKQGSSAVVDASANHQYEVWTDMHCSDPTHSLLSKDHFSNVLNEPAGQVAAAILQYVAPRVIYAWDHPDVDVQQVLDDVVRVFHHPAARQHGVEVQESMFKVIEKWMRRRPDQGRGLDDLLSSESVRAGRNQAGGSGHGHGHGGQGSSGGPMAMLQGKRDVDAGGLSSPSPALPQHEQQLYQTWPQQQQQPTFDPSYQSPAPTTAAWQPPPGPPGPPTDYSQPSWDQGGYQQPPQPAGFAPHDPYAYPTAYQQGYEVPYQDSQGGPPPPPPYGEQQPGYGQGPPPGPPPPGQWGEYEDQSGYGQQGGPYGHQGSQGYGGWDQNQRY